MFLGLFSPNIPIAYNLPFSYGGTIPNSLICLSFCLFVSMTAKLTIWIRLWSNVVLRQANISEWSGPLTENKWNCPCLEMYSRVNKDFEMNSTKSSFREPLLNNLIRVSTCHMLSVLEKSITKRRKLYNYWWFSPRICIVPNLQVSALIFNFLSLSISFDIMQCRTLFMVT